MYTQTVLSSLRGIMYLSLFMIDMKGQLVIFTSFMLYDTNYHLLFPSMLFIC